uniref:Protein kinase domain-containing protein n=1 Tax=viral metagenome TaxID=1070528 RepID=A0A6C0LRS5_9ZZZZ
MFRKSRRQKKQHNKRRRQTKKNNKTIRGAGLPGIFKWATSNIMGETLFGKSIYTIRKENYLDKPNKNDFKTIIMDLYQPYFSLSIVDPASKKITEFQSSKLINDVFKQYNADAVVQKISTNKIIDKKEFEHILHLIQKEYDNNKTIYEPQSVSSVNDTKQEQNISSVVTDTTSPSTISPTSSTSSINNEPSFTQITPSRNVFNSISKMLSSTTQVKQHPYMKYFQGFHELPYSYTNLTKVGKGAYGIVYKAIEENTQQPYALKSIVNAEPKHFEEILNELDILTAVEQNCRKKEDGTMGFIVCFTGITFNKKEIYIVSEFLTDYIEMFGFVYKKRRGGIKYENLPYIIDKICRGLLSIHELGVAHRDIKLENIMINISKNNSDFMNIKYIDFGFSTKVKSDGTYDVGRRFNGELFDTKRIFGTPLYLDPLYIKAHDDVKLNIDILKNSDYYAVGIVIFELICSFFEFDDSKYNENYTPLKFLNINLDKFLMGDSNILKSYENDIKNPDIWFSQVINVSNNIAGIAKKNKQYGVDILKLLLISTDREKGIIPPQ